MDIENIFNFVIMNSETIFKFLVIIFIFYFLFKVNSEKFADTATISAELNTAINTIYDADVGAIRTLSQIATSLNNDVAGLTIPGPLTTTRGINALGNINVSNKTNEGGRINIINEVKNGKAGQTNNWTIYNMTGEYGNKLAFWRYNGDGTNAGPALEIYDDGNTNIKGNANIDGILTTKGRIDAIRADGRATHFDYNGTNYIRGNTHHDNNLTVAGALTLRNGKWDEGSESVTVQDSIWGGWMGLKMCPAGTYVCGLETRFEGDQKGGDDTALNGIKMQCCKF